MGYKHTEVGVIHIEAAAPNGYLIRATPVRSVPYNKIRTGTVEDPRRELKLFSRASPDVCLAKMNIQTLPGCCGVLVLSGFYSYSYGKNAAAVGQANIQKLILAGTEGARKAKFGAVMMTVLDDATLSIRPSAEETFRNGKTGRLVRLEFLDLQQPEPKPVTSTAVNAD